MKAARLLSFGPAENLQVAEVPVPPLQPDDVRIKVIASGVNPIEWKVRSGAMAMVLDRPLPVTLGWECAGLVMKTGPAVRGFHVGDAVFCSTDFGRDGTHAEYVSVRSRCLALKPKSLSFEQAAAAPMSAQAAWSMIEAAGDLRHKRVLITGASGSVGHWLIQLAKQHDSHVTALAGKDQLASVLALGADEAFDHGQPGAMPQTPFDIAFDLVGGETQARASRQLARGSTLVSIAQPPDMEQLASAGVAGRFVFTEPRGEVLGDIAKLIDLGKLMPLPVTLTAPLEAVALVHARGEARNLKGKAILKIATA